MAEMMGEQMMKPVPDELAAKFYRTLHAITADKFGMIMAEWQGKPVAILVVEHAAPKDDPEYKDKVGLEPTLMIMDDAMMDDLVFMGATPVEVVLPDPFYSEVHDEPTDG